MGDTSICLAMFQGEDYNCALPEFENYWSALFSTLKSGSTIDEINDLTS